MFKLASSFNKKEHKVKKRGKSVAKQPAWVCLKLSQLVFTSVCLSGLVACASPKLHINIHAAADINQNVQRQALPVVVRVYQLSDAHAWQAAGFTELWHNDLNVLGQSMLTKTEIIVQPESIRKISVPKHTHMNTVSIMALFREPSAEHWRLSQAVSQNLITKRLATTVDVTITDNQIKLSKHE